MKDKLKKFIEENREDFDKEIPDPRIFKKLEKQLYAGKGNKKNYLVRAVSWAAVIAGIITLSVILFMNMRKDKDETSLTKLPSHNTEELAGIPDPVYAKQIWHFKEIIGLQQTELRQLEKEQPDLYHRFASDIDQLDSAYKVLKTTLAGNPNTEILLEAMIQNLQLQTDLLNRQLSIIKEIKLKRKSYEKSTI